MRHPRVAPIRVVLDHDQATARHEDRPCAAQDLDRVRDEVEAIGRKDTIERTAGQRVPKIADLRLEVAPGELARQLRGEPAERRAVAIERDNHRSWSEQIGQGKGEGALPCPELEPASARGQTRRGDPGPDQGDMIAVVHG